MFTKPLGTAVRSIGAATALAAILSLGTLTGTAAAKEADPLSGLFPGTAVQAPAVHQPVQLADGHDASDEAPAATAHPDGATPVAEEAVPVRPRVYWADGHSYVPVPCPIDDFHDLPALESRLSNTQRLLDDSHRFPPRAPYAWYHDAPAIGGGWDWQRQYPRHRYGWTTHCREVHRGWYDTELECGPVRVPKPLHSQNRGCNCGW